MKKKLVISLVGLLVGFIIIVVLMLGTYTIYLFVFNKTKVSTLEELLNARGYAVLTNDIDCGYETIDSINCDSFDGQGYTIKNAVVSSPNQDYYTASLFNASSVQNLFLENITVKVENALGVGIVSGGNTSYISNVHITNSSIQSKGQMVHGHSLGRAVQECYVGGIYGGIYRETNHGGIVKNLDCVIKNCSVDNLTIEVSGYDGSKANYEDIYIGGIAGACNNITDCSVTNTTISATATGIYNNPHVGGIVGYSEGKIENSFSKDNSLTANANYYSKGAFSLYSTSCLYLGGIVGSLKESGAEINYCYSESNNLNANCSGDIYAGGLIGNADKAAVNQCYSKNSYIAMANYAEGNKNSVIRRTGGLIGSSKNNSVTSCFAYNDNKLIELSSGFKNTSDSKIAGLIADVDSCSVMYCASFNKELVSTTTDEFIPSSISGLKDCFIFNDKFGNINHCGIESEEFWFMPNTIKNSLNLLGTNWQFSTSEIPYLDFNDNN